MMCCSIQCYIPSFVEIGPTVPEEKIVKCFTIYGRAWSCDLDHLYKILFPLPRELYRYLTLLGQAVSEEKTFEIVDGRRRTTTMRDTGPWVSYKLTYESLAQVS